MNRNAYMFYFLCILAIGLIGFTYSQPIALAGQTQQPAQETKAVTTNWEYCAITNYGTTSEGTRVDICYFSPSGCRPDRLELANSIKKADALAIAIAKLGTDGWELVGMGPFELATASTGFYFKRPKR